MTLTPIAHIRSEFPTKFGVPRQSGVVPELTATVVFEPEYRVRDALRGLEGFSHLWLIWGFSGIRQETWSPTVRPPRLGGNARLGVFATRSTHRPNPLGLSAVEIATVAEDAMLGPIIHVRGADLMDGTPIYDIKPYLPYADSIPEATGGFAAAGKGSTLAVEDPKGLLARLPVERREALAAVLALDPRPGYVRDPERVHGFLFAGFDVRFRVAEDVLTIVEID
ncbi:MAG: tRNA (N6-threonylcarbamoyladenosine(37)-N6)-methyltransferase TrmO [Oscillospiraceae bacterium]|nr:tRNA (N6-threonylcarbamoyladenosine(37)-N6)-methyltransferase TrmO [Oscillospiraceae bacterium]